jgi:hypothetical protein
VDNVRKITNMRLLGSLPMDHGTISVKVKTFCYCTKHSDQFYDPRRVLIKGTEGSSLGREADQSPRSVEI